MKKQSVSLLVILMAVSGFLFSCGNKMSKNADAEALKFDSIHIAANQHLFDEPERPACDVQIGLTYVSKAPSDTLKEEINRYLISFALGQDYMNLSPEEAAQQYRDTYVHEYRNDLEPMLLEDEKGKNSDREIGAWYNYYRHISTYVLLNKGELLVYASNWEDYSGGAHGMYSYSFLNLDLKEMRPLHLDDILLGDYTDPLTKLLWEQLIKDQKAESRESLLDMGYASIGELAPTENFYLSKEGITFFYNVYEITPYAMGPVKITLPYSDISHMLSSHTAIRDARS